jgi:type IV pilus assembly protein PilM
MLTPSVAWGIDIGESTVKAVKVRRTKAGSEIVAFDSIERNPPSEESGDKDYQLREALTALAERNRFGSTPIVVSIPEPAFSRFIPLPPVDKKRIPQVVQYEARQQIPFPIEEVVWDYQPVRDASEFGGENEVAIFSLRSQFVYSLLQNLRLCNIHPVAVLPVPLALYNFLTFDRDIAKGTIVVDMGAGSTDILICDPENFRVRNITVSGNGITRALAERLKISREEAEALKRECDDPQQAQRLFKLIQPTLNDLVGQVQRTIGFFKSQIHNVRIEQALLLGSTFRLPGVAEYFVKQLDCDLMSSQTLDRITLAGDVDSGQLKPLLPSLAVALGLGLEGIGLGRVQVNLMPSELLRSQEIEKKKPSAIAAAACLAVMLVANLLSLHFEDERISAGIEKKDEIELKTRELNKDEQDYKKAVAARDAQFGLLDIPEKLSEGHPKPTIGFRGQIDAGNTLNRVLNNVPRTIRLSRLEFKPTLRKFSAEEHGGKGGEKTLPAIQISMAGRVEIPNATGAQEIGQVEERLHKPLQALTAPSGDKTRKVFTHIDFRPQGIDPQRPGVAFTLRCDYLIEH